MSGIRTGALPETWAPPDLVDGDTSQDSAPDSSRDSSPFVDFDRESWARLGANTPLPLTAEELDARVERALSARTQGELAALVADLSAANATKDVLVVKQTGGKWTRAGRWTVPNRIEVRTKLCRVTFDFTDAVITSRTVRIDTDMQHGKLVIVGAPGIVIDADGLNLVFSKTKLRSDNAAADPGLRVELVGTLKHAKVVERRP